MIIINIKVDADDTDTKSPQTFKAVIEVYQNGDKGPDVPHFHLKNKNFRQLMKIALDKASSEKRHYEMLGYKVKVRVDWEQYDFEYNEEENMWEPDQGLTFKQFLGIFDESMKEAKLPAEALNDFLDNLLFDHNRETYKNMDDDEKLVVKFALSYGMNVLSDKCESKAHTLLFLIEGSWKKHDKVKTPEGKGVIEKVADGVITVRLEDDTVVEYKPDELKRHRLTKEQKKALNDYLFRVREEDRYFGSVFVSPLPSVQNAVKAKTKAAYDLCVRLGLSWVDGL